MKQIKLTTEKMLLETNGPVSWITFNQPEKRNAISLAMWEGLAEALALSMDDEAIKVIVLKGAGGQAFVSGADISEFDQKRNSAEAKAAYAQIAGQASRYLRQSDKPVIALIEGYCIGGGLATALQADVRFATPGSTFGIPAARLGLGYEYEGLRLLTQIVGPSRARDIMMSARLFKADEALEMGLVNFVESEGDIHDAVAAYAERIASNAPLTIRAARAAISDVMLEASKRDRPGVQALIDACFDSEDYREGRRAFAEKRPPQFRGK